MPWPSERIDGPPEHTIWLVHGTVHTDLVFPIAPRFRDQIDDIAPGRVPADVDHVLIGWGSEQVYTTTGRWRDVEVGRIVKAAIGDRGVLQIMPVPPTAPSPDTWGGAVDRFEFSQEALFLLQTSILRDITGPPRTASLTRGDLFLPTATRFSLRRTCNQWIGARLREAGLRTGLFTPLPHMLRLSLWLGA
ncbi:MAG: DUF2459 domain-containing protein [Shimia sp.]